MLNDSFFYHDGFLHCDALDLRILAEHTGTPVYVYSASRIRANLCRLQNAFAPLDAVLHYSIKANGNLALLRLISQAGIDMDAVSGGEIYRARRAGVAPQRILFAGVGKTSAEIRYALDEKVEWFNVESADELCLLNTLACTASYTPSVVLRLNPGIEAQTHRHIATGHARAKFGMPAPIIAELLVHRADYPHVRIAGLHLHIGSQLGDVQETVQAVQLAQALLAPYPDIYTLDIGGGFPVAYTTDDEYPAPDAFAKALFPLLKGWQIFVEPGRSVVADAGVLLVSVLYHKEQGGQRFVIVDGSMTDLIRPALYEAVHPVVPLHKTELNLRDAMVVGPVCESTDVLNRSCLLPDLSASDYLAVMGAGAYGMVMASNYNMRPRAPEVLVENNTWRVIRRRETWDDVLRCEEDEV
ncbi:MAG TPA: diaminopimelate decarboxylase [Aggregatilineaceae bacterium]|nr:diaminopimelate decarboxylase [Aggregatilineaceae bacterium]